MEAMPVDATFHLNLFDSDRFSVFLQFEVKTSEKTVGELFKTQKHLFPENVF